MKLIVKRLIDVTLAVLGMILCAPAFAAVSIAICLAMGRPVLFRQARAGYRARPFTLYKFRTIQAGCGADAERLTRLGRFLRKSSLDELPQLWNVLRGDLSLVGPRPLLMQYLSLYTPEQYRRHEVQPGITGWAQINGRNSIGWDEKFRYDVWYVDHWSIWLDLKILVLTLIVVVRIGAGQEEDGGTTPPFLGLKGEGHENGLGDRSGRTR